MWSLTNNRSLVLGLAVAVAVAIAAVTPVMSAETSLLASDARVDWAGRRTANADGSVAFDWLGVTARIQVQGATYVTATITSSSANRGTRLKAYISNQGFPLYPQVQFWVPPQSRVAVLGNTSTLYLGGGGSMVVTLENLVDPQYGTGKTTVWAFHTDGTFTTPPPRQPTEASPIPAGGHRRMEIIGDSITAATNVVRPPGAPGCGDGGYQSDWSQTYSGLLCHRFGADCSTVAVGGKCVMRECGGLQMPDYFTGAFYEDGNKPTYNFSSWAPDAMVIDLGTNDAGAIAKIGPTGMARFTAETVQFMKTATVLYSKPDIQFFLTAGPMENTTLSGTTAAVVAGKAAGLKVTFIDMTGACAQARQHGNTDECDGCAGHPGIEGHRGMYEAAWPVIGQVMGWN